MQELDFTYEEDTIEAVIGRALDVYVRLRERHDFDAEIRASIYNSILNMVAQVNVGNIVVPRANSDLTKRHP